MIQKPRQLAALIVLAVVCVVVYTRAFRRPADRAVALPPLGHMDSSTPLEPLQVVQPSPQREAQRERAKLLAWGRDPFLRGSIDSMSGLNLSGIIWDKASPVALINGMPLTVGEEIDGFRIVEILPDRVTITDGTTTHHLRIIP